MGVDTSIKIRLYQTESDIYNEVQVSDQDNALGDVFTNSSIRYTSIQFDKSTELSEEESSLFDLFQSEEDEMKMETKLIDGNQAALVFGKILRLLYRRKWDALNSDLKKIDLLEIAEEEKDKRKRNTIGEYIGFEMSFSTMNGIVKTAKELNCKIQIIAEFY